jgi:hypothetical protein
VARRVVLAAAACVLIVAALVAPAASGAKPTIERIAVDETFPDEFLTEACGFPVTTRARGHVITRTFTRAGTRVVEVRTINIALTAMANGKTYRFRDVGADITRRTRNGIEILMLIGQLPFAHTGVLKINLTTGEVIHEPRHSTEGEVEEVCAALAPSP